MKSFDYFFKNWDSDPILNSLPFAIALISFPSFRYVKVNSTYCSRLKVPLNPEELKNVEVSRVLSNPSPDAMEALRAAHHGKVITRTRQAASENFLGGTSYWDATVAPLDQKRGETVAISFMNDITECISLKAKLKECDEVLKRGCHNLRTPLTAIKITAQVMEKKSEKISPKEISFYVGRMDGYIARLANEITLLESG